MKYTILFLILVMVPSSLAYICQDVTTPENIPCTVITPSLNCDNYTYNITNTTSGSVILVDGNLTSNDNGTYNYTFDYGLGDYMHTLCDGTQAFQTVGYDADFPYYYIYLLTFFSAGLFFFLGFKLEQGKGIFYFVSGALLVVVGILLLQLGFSTLNIILTNGLAAMFMGLGFYIMLVPNLERLEKLLG